MLSFFRTVARPCLLLSASWKAYPEILSNVYWSWGHQEAGKYVTSWTCSQEGKAVEKKVLSWAGLGLQDEEILIFWLLSIIVSYSWLQKFQTLLFSNSLNPHLCLKINYFTQTNMSILSTCLIFSFSFPSLLSLSLSQPLLPYIWTTSEPPTVPSTT